LKCVRHQGATHLSHPIRIAFRFRKVRFEDSRDIDICVLIHPKDQVERPGSVGGVFVVWLVTGFRDEIFVSIFVSPIMRVLYLLGERVMRADSCVKDSDFDIRDTAPGVPARRHHFDDIIGSFNPLRRRIRGPEHSLGY
jgi:hypothetical protein